MRINFVIQKLMAMSPPPTGAKTSGLETLIPFLFYLGLFLIFYFLIIRPQSKRTKQVKVMQDSLKKGDSVVTTGGIYATVYKIKDDNITLEIAEGVRIKAQRVAISEVTNPSGDSGEDK